MRVRPTLPCFWLPWSLLACFTMQAGCLQDASPPSVEQGLAVLATLLGDTNPDIRRTATESLGKIGDPSAIPMVLPLLTDPMPGVRAAAAQALGRIAAPADKDVIGGLVRALEDPSDGVKRMAAVAIGDIEPPPTRLESVGNLLRSSDVHVRRATVRALLLLDTAHVVELLLPLVDDPDPDVRQGAVAALGLSRDVRAGSALAKHLLRDPSAAVRAEAAYHLGQVDGPPTRSLLQTAIEKEEDRGVRRWIETGLTALRASD